MIQCKLKQLTQNHVSWSRVWWTKECHQHQKSKHLYHHLPNYSSCLGKAWLPRLLSRSLLYTETISCNVWWNLHILVALPQTPWCCLAQHWSSNSHNNSSRKRQPRLSLFCSKYSNLQLLSRCRGLSKLAWTPNFLPFPAQRRRGVIEFGLWEASW